MWHSLDDFAVLVLKLFLNKVYSRCVAAHDSLADPVGEFKTNWGLVPEIRF